MNLEKAKPGVPVTINGKQETLICDWWCLSVVEEEKGDAFLTELSAQLKDKRFSVGNVAFLTWALLLRTHPELDGVTPEQRRAGRRTVAQWCSEGVVTSELAAAVLTALANSSPEGDAPKNEESNAASQ